MDEKPVRKMGRIQYAARLLVLFTLYLFDRAVDGCARRVRVLLREPDLFIGIGLVLLGALNFNTGRYCDGTSGDYASCTRPAVYYYFDALDIALIILGVFLLLFSYVQWRER